MHCSMMVRAIQDPEKWMAALMLDPDTGLDPPGVKIRAAQGWYHHLGEGILTDSPLQVLTQRRSSLKATGSGKGTS